MGGSAVLGAEVRGARWEDKGMVGSHYCEAKWRCGQAEAMCPGCLHTKQMLQSLAMCPSRPHLKQEEEDSPDNRRGHCAAWWSGLPHLNERKKEMYQECWE